MKRLFNWIGNALSEKGVPSSKRLVLFMFAVTTCACVVYAVHKLHAFPQYLYYGLLIMIALLAGVATVPQIMEIWRGKSAPIDPPKSEPNS